MSGDFSVEDTPLARPMAEKARTVEDTPMPGGVADTPLPSREGQDDKETDPSDKWKTLVARHNVKVDAAELDTIFPKDGYVIVEPPAAYNPVKSEDLRPQTQASETPLYQIPVELPRNAMGAGEGEEGAANLKDLINMDPELPFTSQADVSIFGKLLEDDEGGNTLTLEETKERQIMKLLLNIKNGSPPIRKLSLREITAKARYFGPEALFNQILPLFVNASLDEQERHLIVKVVDRVLFKLDHLVRPYVSKILIVCEPLLVDDDHIARAEGREIISNLTKAAGLPAILAAMRNHIVSMDEHVRHTTARALAVVSGSVGISQMIPFLKAVCASKKSWQARHTGVKVIQQIAALVGCGVLPHLTELVEIASAGLQDDQLKVKTMTALALSACADAAHPYGIESFDIVLRPLWQGILDHRGKALAAYLKAIGSIIPLMEPDHANYYTREVMLILVREFSTPDEELRRICLRVIKQCVTTEGVEAEYIRTEVLPVFLKNFWVVRMAIEKRNSRPLIETTVALAQKVGGRPIINEIVEGLKNSSEPYRRMTMETIHRIVEKISTDSIDARLEELLMDGCFRAFQENTAETHDTFNFKGPTQDVILSGIGAICKALKSRVKPYLPQICYFIRWRINNPSTFLRMQAAELIIHLAPVIKMCEEETTLSHLGLYCYEFLGEETAEVLGSILGALRAICNNLEMSKMSPAVKDLVPRLTPILRNRHDKVQENVVRLVGTIADRGSEFCPPREWHRICWELLELLKAPRKSIRQAAIHTFGYIAKAIGPHDVLSTLLNNLKVQERQLRVCTTIAIGVIADTCGPFTVLPAMMNEYRTPELHVRNGILKSLSFMFEYIGELAKDYVNALIPLLDDALTDRDLVHRQTAISVIKHLALDIHGQKCHDILVHLLNLVMPNIFETAPHLLQYMFDAMDSFRISLGPGILLYYYLEGLFAAAKRVREIYWRMYNNLYIGAQGSLVMYYPNIYNNKYDLDNDYTKDGYLEYVL